MWYAVWEWAALAAVFAVCVFLDLVVLNRGRRSLSLGQAALQLLLWFLIAVAVGIAIWSIRGGIAGQQYFTGYFIEYSLSFDNVFVWSVIVAQLVPEHDHHALLVWGVAMSIVLRVAFVTVGMVVIQRFEWVMIVFALLLLYTGIKLRSGAPDAEDPLVLEAQWYWRYTIKVLHGIKLTRFGIAIIVFGFVDVLFAFDSIPAIFGLTRDQFVIISVNTMALLGLQAAYTLFDAIKHAFSRVSEGLAIILASMGVKMLLENKSFMGWVNWIVREVNPQWHIKAIEVPAVWSLLCTIGILLMCVLWSILSREKTPQ